MNYPDLTMFTPREYDVLQLCAKGYSNKEIAKELKLSIHTVKLHIHNLLKKFDTPYREKIAVTALQYNLVNPYKFITLQQALIELGYAPVDTNEIS